MFVIILMIVLDMIGRQTTIGAFYLSAGVIGVYLTGDIFANQGVVQSVAYTGSFVTRVVDPNIYAVISAVVTILSFYFVFFEREFNG